MIWTTWRHRTWEDVMSSCPSHFYLIRSIQTSSAWPPKKRTSRCGTTSEKKIKDEDDGLRVCLLVFFSFLRYLTHIVVSLRFVQCLKSKSWNSILPSTNMSDNSTRLFCLVGECDVLRLKVGNSDDIFDLRDQIRSSLEHSVLKNVDASNLDIWKVRAWIWDILHYRSTVCHSSTGLSLLHQRPR